MTTMKDVGYVIVQAGGKGTRLGKYTTNRPKCLVPIFRKTLIEHTIDVFRDKRVIVIGDHLFDVLKTYVETMVKPENVVLIETKEHGTAAGIREALEHVPDGAPFAVTWSDLLFKSAPELDFDTEMAIGLAGNFDCRWSYVDGRLVDRPGRQNGVAGFFVFRDKAKFGALNTEKSFVRGFLSENFAPEETSTFVLSDCREVGTVQQYESMLDTAVNHRFFNEVKIERYSVTKRCVDPDYQKVHDAEREWYRALGNRCPHVPIIFCYEPLMMERVDGCHPWRSDDKQRVLSHICDALDDLHALGKKEGDAAECMGVYFSKPYQRVMEVAPIIPGLDRPMITINGKKCYNPIYNLESFESIVSELIGKPIEYTVIHGDTTFSNIMVGRSGKIKLIDPRGVFGSTKLYGDPRYDWAKLYYSAIGNYDSINSRKFSVYPSVENIKTSIESNGYDVFEDMILERSGIGKREMLILQVTIWLSLTGYVKEDIDASLYSFYKACELWTQLLELGY